MTAIDIDYAWRSLRDACTGRGDGMTPAVTIDADGRWRADGAVEPEAAALLDTLAPITRAGTVVGQLGQSLDGRIATITGASHYVTGAASRTHLHRLRALVDAVVVGAGTAQADDPRLTVRHVDGADPVRVVLDPNARVGPDRLLFTDGAAPTLHVVAQGRRACRGPGVETVAVAPDAAGALAPATLLAALAARGLRRVLVEGGGLTVSRFLAAGLLDRLHVVVAPMVIGSGRPAVTLAEIETLDAALRPPCCTHALDADTLFDLDLGGPG
ncbi:deaminase [Salinisphaera orenii MK-B5]|uniref:Deaminase n=2 Tax=Salinisphaera TaxID=180541 RepID=A0A423PXY4_9GAMM|nr:deaminase [Salinisphaera orenii MK-B5]